MKGDIGLFLKDNLFDLQIANGDLTGDNGLETAVSISLFTDRRVSDEELPPLEKNKKGWWGDMFPEVDQDQIGSRLWLLNREKRTQETLRRAEDYAKEALKWLIDDGVASSITTVAIYDTNKFLQLDVTITRPTGRSSRYLVLWDEQALKRG